MNQNRRLLVKIRHISIIIGILILVFCQPVMASDMSTSIEPATISFLLTDYGEKDILRVSLMKEGESNKNGMSRQYQNIRFDRESGIVEWTPCNDNSCTITSTKTAGGKTGRDQLILEVTFANPSIDVSSCYGVPTCERLRGGTTVKSGMLEGFFKTGMTYSISLDSLKSGIGEAYISTKL
ncbi:MAG: hypothetical protein GXY48_11675 [Methanomicrobiales archaeon]|nr:hypothetical protein [Methanomicrobiales archaeon]